MKAAKSFSAHSSKGITITGQTGVRLGGDGDVALDATGSTQDKQDMSWSGSDDGGSMITEEMSNANVEH
eukprot:COSAG01_NODE_52976_length_342_cov_1.119342_1_plen_68_part_10